MSLRQLNKSLSRKAKKHYKACRDTLRYMKRDPDSLVELSQENFDNGTVIIAKDYYILTQNGETVKIEGSTDGKVFRLSEDISFNPNSSAQLKKYGYESGDVQPEQFTHAGGHYDPAAFGIGFFAAISLFAYNVIIDFNGHTLAQSKEHALQQRFFALIELANMPFIPSQGPHTFGTTVLSASKCKIINGTIGMSSHHGIHGNGPDNLYIKNLTITQFEVAAIAINGGNELYIIDTHIKNSRSDVPILAIFSAARFLRPYINKLYKDNSDITLTVKDEELTVGQIRNRLAGSMNSTFDEVLATGKTTNTLFENHIGTIDGNFYGFVINNFGVAVNGFPVERNNPARNIYMNNVTINNVNGFINEVPAIRDESNGEGEGDSYTSGPHEKDSVGAVFQTQNKDKDGNNLTIDEEGKYTGNEVSNAQAIVCKAILASYDFGALSTKRNSITQNTIDWVEQRKTLEEAGISYIFNGDAMHHANKGGIGFKMDACEDAVMVNCSCTNMNNLTPRNGLIADNLVEYIVPDDEFDLYWNYIKKRAKSNKNNTYYGNQGLSIRGFSLASSKDVYIKSSGAQNITSTFGQIIGFDIHQTAENVTLERCYCNDFSAAEGKDIDLWDDNPTILPDSTGFKVGELVNKIALSGCTSKNLKSVSEAKSFKIDSESVSVN